METIIVVGTDGSTAADQAVMWAAAEADRAGNDLHVVHVCELPVPAYAPFGFDVSAYQIDVPQMLAAGHKLVDAAVSQVHQRFPDLTVRGIVERGEVGHVLVDLSTGARLLVVATHEHHLVSDVILGSHSRFVLHHGLTNVAVVPYVVSDAETSAIRRITVGVDGSETAALALEWAAEEAQLWGAAVTVVHTWEYPYFAPKSAVTVASALEAHAEEETESSVAALRAKRPDLNDVAVDRSVVIGSPAKQLIEAAETSDLLVVGSRGRGGFRSLLLGSVSHQVAQHAIVPVVVIRQPAN
jgi:nucleotide-binding universal stress UspA family protein